MDSERFKNISEGIKNLSMAIAVVGAALWAYYQFVVTGVAKTAREDYISLTRANYQYADISVNITAKAVSAGRKGAVQLFGSVKIENLGNRLALVELDPEGWPLMLSKVNYDVSKGLFEFDEVGKFRFAREDNTMTTVVSLNSKQSHSLPFAFPIKSAGLYMLRFASTAVPEDNVLPKVTTGGVELSPVNWFKQELVNIDAGEWTELISGG